MLGEDMTSQNERPSPAHEGIQRPEAGPRPGPKPQQAAEGVRRQREHIEKLDGADPLRGGVAD